VRLLDRYLGRVLLGAIGLTLAILLGLFVLFEFVEQLAKLGEGSYGIANITLYVASRIPRLCYDLLPLALLVGSLLGLGLLGRSGELAVMRCAGMSRIAITAAALKAGAVGIIISLVLGEFVAPVTERHAGTMQRNALASGKAQSSEPAGEGKSGGAALWLRDGDSFVRVGRLLTADTIGDVQIHEYDSAHRLRTATRAATAAFDGERWQLREVRRTSFADGEVSGVAVSATGVWDARLRPNLLEVLLVPAERQSVFALRRYITYLRANDLDAERFDYAFWRKTVYPLTTAVMILLAVPLALRRSSRSGSTGQMLLLGALAGIAFHLGSRVSVNLAMVAQVPAPIGVGAPVLLVALAALALLRRTG
jgi:lipopolysaccharide export system permease protein